MENTNWTYFLALFSVVLGWFLNELGLWFRTRRDDRKIKKQILFNLLETYFIFNQFDTSEIIELTTESILERAPENERTEENKQQLNQLYSGLIQGIIRDNATKNLNKIEEKYNEAVQNLASIDPITAFRLNGKTKIIQTFELVKDYYDEIEKQHPDESGELQSQIETAVEGIKPEIIKEAIMNLEDEIHGISLSIDILTWIRTKRTLKVSRERLKGKVKREMNEFIDKFLTQVKGI